MTAISDKESIRESDHEAIDLLIEKKISQDPTMKRLAKLCDALERVLKRQSVVDRYGPSEI